MKLRSCLVAALSLTAAWWSFSTDRLIGAALPQVPVQGGVRGVATGQAPGRGAAAQQAPQKGADLVIGQRVDATTGQPVSDAVVTMPSAVPVHAVAPPSD